MNDWLDAEQRVERAQQLSESQRWAEALAEIELAISINPNNAAWHAQRGYILEELEDAEEAVRAFEKARELDPGDRDVAVALGVALIQLERYARAVEVFEGLASAYPDYEPAYCHRIAAYAQLGLHDKAEEMFYLAQHLDDRCPHCFFQIAGSLQARGLTDRAIFCWERVLKLDPSYLGVNRRIAQAHRGNGKLAEARDFFLRELREDPGNTDLLYELAELTLASGNIGAAAAKFAHILELDPGNAKARFALGKIWLAKGHPQRALICFNAIEQNRVCDKDLAELDYKAGTALYQLKRFDEAKERLQSAAGRDTSNVDALMLLGNCLLASAKPVEAANCYRRVLALDAANPYAHNNLALCLFQMDRHSSALEHCLQAIRARPDYVTAMRNAVIAYLHLARWTEARTMLRRALRREPRDETLRTLSGRIWRFRFGHYARRVSSWLHRSVRAGRI